MGVPIPSASSLKVYNLIPNDRSIELQNTGSVTLSLNNDQDGMDASVDPVTGSVTEGMILQPGEKLFLDLWKGELFARAWGVPGELDVRWSGMEPQKPGSEGRNLPLAAPPRPTVKEKLKPRWGTGW